MQLPPILQEALEQELLSYSSDQLRSASRLLSEHYRGERNSKQIFEQGASRLAYLLARMPATYAALMRVLQEMQERLGAAFSIRSLLDLGAGPGTGGWAASDVFEGLSQVRCVEQSASMAQLGEKLFQKSDRSVLHAAKWDVKSLAAPFESADLALLSYVIGELKEPQIRSLLEALLQAEIPLIAVVEPGTKAGFQRILSVRFWAIAQGLQILAPCPHRQACPMQAREDWCHFPARVERTRMHKFLKDASLGYEDEKFSYVVFGKIFIDPPHARIVGPVRKMSGFVSLPLCVEGKLEETTVSKKQTSYKLARHAEWGDSFV